MRDVSRGKRYLGNEMAQKMALGAMADATPFDGLSSREFEIAMLLCRGIRADDIAKRLSLSPKTVATHKTRMLQKLGLFDAIAMVTDAFCNMGLTDSY